MNAPRDRDTTELLEHLRSRRQRRRTAGALLALVGGVVVLAGAVTGAVLATGSESQSSSSTVVARAGASTTVRTTESTSEPPSTTPATTSEAGTTSTERSTTSAPATTSVTTWLAGKVVAIDPGHQAEADPTLEPIGPGSKQMKAKVSSGTAGVTTGTPESEVALAVGLKLREALEALGVKVVMTRTTQDVEISNSERAQVGNEAKADLAIRLHCNGSPDRSVHGLFTLYPASIKGWTDDIAAASKTAAIIIQREAIAATGAQDRGVHERSDLTGFNWSDVPDVLVEMGFMSNAAEDKLLESATYQDKIVQGLVNGIVEFLRTE